MPSVSDLFGQLVSTYKEWHYLAVGLSIGALVGWIGRSVFAKVLDG